ncbi:hypothetical protein [Rhizobium chutanense]|uniref:hypothetical protein n=1 Tax=Rhizobium chutanense TaxID=2035448 RepID=UPI001FDF6715|nr:hypothetical protein [Rhizobium chutanense]
MTEEKQTPVRGLISLVKIAWTVSVVIVAAAVGACIGWQNHGLAGALALGFVGLVAGGFLSSPSFLLEMLVGLI